MEKQAFKKVPVESSNIAYVGHSYPRRLLEVGFRDGSVYRYKGVKNKTYRELLNADSKGKAFHRLIRGQYPYRKVVNKDGETIKSQYGQVQKMRDFDEFTKTAGVVSSFANAFSGRNIDQAKKRFSRLADHYEKMDDVIGRRDAAANVARKQYEAMGADYRKKTNNLRAANQKVKSTRNDFKAEAGKIKSSEGIFNKIKGAASTAEKGADLLKAKGGAAAASRSANAAKKDFMAADGAFTRARNKWEKSTNFQNKIYDSAMKAKKDITKERLKTIGSRGLVGAGILAAGVAGKKLYDKYKNPKPQPAQEQTYQDTPYQQPQY